MTFNDYPKAATVNAKRALKFREETDNKKGCGTPVGWARANQLAKRENISLDTVKRMASFNRHRQNKDVPYEEGCGGLMWDAWGGTEGVDWAIRKSQQIEKEMKENALYEYSILNDVFDTGEEVDALASILAEADGGKVQINIASDGGEVFLGLKLAGLISAYKGETVANVYGLAASIATIVALSADKVMINKFAFFMIHNSWALMQGNKEEIKKQSRTLKDIDALLASIYVEKIKRNGKLVNNSEEETIAKIKTMMAQETFLPADKALEMGLVDGYIQKPSTNLEQIAFANAKNKNIFYNQFPKQYNRMKDKQNIFAVMFAAMLSAFGFNKDEALEAVAGDSSSDATEVLLPENSADPVEAKKAMEEDEKKKKENEDDEYKMLKEKLKAMEEEIKQMKEEKKAMEEELKKEKKSNAELQTAVEAKSSFATTKGGAKAEIKQDSIFSPETQAKLNALFNKATR